MCQYFFFARLFDVTEVIVTIVHLKSKVGTFLDPDVSVWLFFWTMSDIFVTLCFLHQDYRDSSRQKLPRYLLIF